MSTRGCTNCAPCCVCGDDSEERDAEIARLREENSALRAARHQARLLAALKEALDRLGRSMGTGPGFELDWEWYRDMRKEFGL